MHALNLKPLLGNALSRANKTQKKFKNEGKITRKELDMVILICGYISMFGLMLCYPAASV